MNPTSSIHSPTLHDSTCFKAKETHPEVSVHIAIQPAQTAACCKLGLGEERGERSPPWDRSRNGSTGSPRCSAMITFKERHIYSCTTGLWLPPALRPGCSHRKGQAHDRNCRLGDRLSKGAHVCVHAHTCTHACAPTAWGQDCMVRRHQLFSLSRRCRLSSWFYRSPGAVLSPKALLEKLSWFS